jgi:hypothetical protein
MRDIYSRLHTQPFPNLGHTLEITATKFDYRPSDLQRPRRGSLGFFLQQFQPQQSPASLLTMSSASSIRRVKRIRRPIDFRMDGSPICRMLSTQQILLLYSTILKERRLLVISSSLR